MLNIIVPTGNSTALVISSEKVKDKKKINDFIISKHKDIEQVGFINKDTNNPELVMAGGEFCVNATRSAVNYYLNNSKGRIKINIPNLNFVIEGGIDDKGETWVLLNIFKRVSEKYSKIAKCKVIIVEFKGIVHAILRDEIIRDKNDEEIKEIAFSLLKELDLTKYKAAGIIFKNYKNRITRITPVVYVKNVNTLFIETACGSGSAAIAIYNYFKYNVSNCRIVQPSKMCLNTKVYADGNKIKSIKISGKVYEIKK